MLRFHILAFSLLFVTLWSCTRNNGTIEFSPIGYFSSEYNANIGAPRQGTLVPESKGIINLEPELADGLHELHEFEYIWVLFHFDRAIGYDLKVSPPNSEHSFGVFASRSPRRPNPIGMSLMRLDSIKDNKLFVSGVDVFNGTPVLDIKPYLPSVDIALSKTNAKAEKELGHHDGDFLNDSLVNFYVFGSTK